MNKAIVILVLQSLWLAGCGSEAPPAASEASTAMVPEAFSRGPHNGRLLMNGNFSVELAIFETGVPPEFRAWITANGQPVDLASVVLNVALTRLGGTVDRIEFSPSGDFMRGNATVYEPHSFDVTVSILHGTKAYEWTYASYEGRTVIAADVASAAGVATAVAGAGTIVETIPLYGSISPDSTRVRKVKARFPGVIRSVNHQIGDAVRAGDVLATVESNESLQNFSVNAPIAGVVTARNAEPGEQTGSEPLFEIADFSRVWAEFGVFPRDRPRLRAGQQVVVTGEGMAEATGPISYLAPTGDRSSQSVTARVVLHNVAGRWTPGQFVEGRATVAETPVNLVVPLSALQSFRDFTVVFAQVGDTYEVRMLELGRRDAKYAEVLNGLAPGTVYVTENSYLIKADIEKSGASHDH